MKIRVSAITMGLIFVCSAALCVYGQQKSDSSNTSLGDLARQLKAQKAKEPKPAMVITNDNIPTPKNDSTFNAGASGKSTAESSSSGSGGASEAHDEKYYHAHYSKLQDQLETDKRELAVLQQKLGQNQTQYYSDPNKTLMQEYSRDDINKLNSDIEAKKQKVADDEKAIEDLRDQLRHEGGDPGWLR